MSGRVLKIFICAGEVSGDMHAAALMRAMRSLSSNQLEFRGFGGDMMRSEGAELLYHTDQIGIMGITPVLMNLPFLLRVMSRVKQDIARWQPDLVLTVDYPGMNMRIGEFARRRGLRTAHYICPKVWAWSRGRIPKIARDYDLLLCILPFEPALFEGTGLRALYTGNPLVNRVAEAVAQELVELPWQGGRYKVALLPGSRASEIKRILPRLLRAGELLEQRLDGECSFIIPTPGQKIRALAEQVAGECGGGAGRLSFIDGQAREVLRQADCAAVASGTATLEASLLRCPTVLVYAASGITAMVARRLVKGVKYIGLANIIAGSEVMPEILQEEFTPERVADQLYAYLSDSKVRGCAKSELERANALLGNADASREAAEALVSHFCL